MAECVNISLNNQTFKTNSVVIGAAAKGPAVAGLTVYGNISASGSIYGVDTGFVKIRLTGNGGNKYQLPFYPSPNSEDYIVSIDGVLQESINSYSVSFTTPRTITFTENIPVNSVILILVIRSIAVNSTNVPTFKKNQFTTTYFQFSYPLTSYSNENPNNYFVFLDGVMQSPQEDFTLSGNKIVLTAPPSDNQKLLVMSLQNADGTYATNTEAKADILPKNATDGQSLVYRNESSAWIPQYVLPQNASNGQSLVYNTTSKTWAAQHVIPTEASYGQVLTYNGSWVPKHLLPITATNDQVLSYDSATDSWLAKTLNVVQNPNGAIAGQALVWNGITWAAQYVLPTNASPKQSVVWNGTAWTSQYVLPLSADTGQSLVWNGMEWTPRDILPTSATTGQVIRWSGSLGWTAQTIVPATAVVGQSLKWNGTSWTNDYIVPSTASTGQSLVWNGSNWVGQYILPSSANSGQVLTWNGSTWIAQAIVTSGTGTPVGAASGDLGGNYPGPSVTKLQGYPVSSAPPAANQILTWNASLNSWVPSAAPTGLPSTASNGQAVVWNGTNWIGQHILPTSVNSGQSVVWNGASWVSQYLLPVTAVNGQVLTWNGNNWVAQTIVTSSGSGSPIGPAGGDLGGNYPNPTVAKLQGFAVSNTAPVANQVLVWNSSSNAWVPSTSPSSLPGGSNGQILMHNGSSWQPSSIPGIVTNNVDNAPIGSVCWFAAITPPVGYLECNGTAVNRTTYADLDAAIYCGDGNNASAGFGYRCTNSTTPATTRSTTGQFIVLPDLRAEFIRGWDRGKGVDNGRVFGSNQGDDFKSHSHTIRGDNNNDNGLGGVLGGSGRNFGGFFAGRIGETGGTETRPRNVALLPCIKVLKTVTGSVQSLNFIEKPAAANGQVLGFDSSTNSWKATTPASQQNFTRGGGIAIYDSPGTSSWAIPSNVGSVRVHVIGAGGGTSSGGDSTFNLTVNGIPIGVTAKGGGGATGQAGGKGGDVAAVAANSSINFTGVGGGTGGTGGTYQNKGNAGTGTRGGYGGGGGGGSGGSLIAAYDATPVGTISFFSTSTVPNSYLECNGAVINRATYADLFAVIGIAYNTGGELSSQFRLPDLRGEFIRGWDNSRGVDSGRTIGSKQTDEVKSHTHNYIDTYFKEHWGPDGRYSGAIGSHGGQDNDNSDYNYSRTTAANGGTETRPRNIALLPCIKATKTSVIDVSQTGGGGGGSGIGGGGGGGISGMGGDSTAYGGQGNSDAQWGPKSGGYGGGGTLTNAGGGGGGAYAVFSIDVTPGGTATIAVGAGGATIAGGVSGKPGAVIIEW